jgi:hypothetical protein
MQSTRLHQALEESKTANILLCLGVKADAAASASDGVKEEGPGGARLNVEPMPLPSAKGNIIDQLRTSVRAEAALHKQLAKKGQSSNASSSSSSSSSKEPVIGKGEIEDDEDDDESISGSNFSRDNSINWKNGTVITLDGIERRLSNEEMEEMRRERNRVHAKLTRDRKKLFTSRIQQMISTLERQNQILRCRLQSQAGPGAQASPSGSSGEDRDGGNSPLDEEKRLQLHEQKIREHIRQQQMHQLMLLQQQQQRIMPAGGIPGGMPHRHGPPPGFIYPPPAHMGNGPPMMGPMNPMLQTRLQQHLAAQGRGRMDPSMMMGPHQPVHLADYPPHHHAMPRFPGMPGMPPMHGPMGEMGGPMGGFIWPPGMAGPFGPHAPFRGSSQNDPLYAVRSDNSSENSSSSRASSSSSDRNSDNLSSQSGSSSST